MVAVPSPLPVKVTPDGRAPDSVTAATGLPVVVTVNDPAVPSANVAAATLVICGGVVPEVVLVSENLTSASPVVLAVTS